MVKYIFIIFGACLLSALLYLVYRNKAIPSLGVHEDNLSPCPNRPNCVSSQATRSWQYVAPLAVKEEKDPISKIKKIIQNDPSVTVLKETPTYLHVVFRSPFFRFADDTEFFFNQKKGVLEIRSAARTGYYDFGVNRSHIKNVRKKFEN